MFDKLVESTKQKGGRRTGRYFAITCGVYAFALTVMGIGTILMFSPVLAEQYSLVLPIVPPVLGRQEQAPQTRRRKLKLEPVQGFVVPKKPIAIPPVEDVKSGPRIAFTKYEGIGRPPGIGDPNGVIRDDDSTPPPPLSDTRKKQIIETTPSPTPALKQGPNKVSEGVLVGSAIRKVKPAYPQIAKAAGAERLPHRHLSLPRRPSRQ